MYIQNLIANTNIPIIDTVKNGDYIIKGHRYIYGFDIITCTHSGFIGLESRDALKPLDTLLPANDLFPSDGIEGAEYELTTRFQFGKEYRQLTHKHIPNTNFYDSDTHFWLGKYLRCIRDIYGVNYMPFYNCYNAKSLTNLSAEYNYEYVYAVPIKFNTTYTVSYKSNYAVIIAPVIYSDRVLKFDNYVGTEEEMAGLQSAVRNIM